MSGCSNDTIYVHESGDCSLVSINPKYPLFVRAFCRAAKEDYRAQIAPEMTGVKHRWFGHEAERLIQVLVQSRGRKEDADLELVLRRICDGANAFGRRLPFEVVFVDKRQNMPGLELADLVCHPIGRPLCRLQAPR